MKWVKSLNKYIKIKEDSIIFEEGKFITAYLNKNNKISEKKKYMHELEKMKPKLSQDVRLSMRGHDFTNIFYSLYRKTNSKPKFDNNEAFVASLWGCLEMSMIEKEDLFKKLEKI